MPIEHCEVVLLPRGYPLDVRVGVSVHVYCLPLDGGESIAFSFRVSVPDFCFGSHDLGVGRLPLRDIGRLADPDADC